MQDREGVEGERELAEFVPLSPLVRGDAFFVVDVDEIESLAHFLLIKIFGSACENDDAFRLQLRFWYPKIQNKKTRAHAPLTGIGFPNDLCVSTSLEVIAFSLLQTSGEWKQIAKRTRSSGNDEASRLFESRVLEIEAVRGGLVDLERGADPLVRRERHATVLGEDDGSLAERPEFVGRPLVFENRRRERGEHALDDPEVPRKAFDPLQRLGSTVRAPSRARRSET